MSDNYLKMILNSRVYDVASKTPLDFAKNLSRSQGGQADRVLALPCVTVRDFQLARGDQAQRHGHRRRVHLDAIRAGLESRESVDAVRVGGRASDEGLAPRAAIVRADGRALPFRAGSFDGVTHADVLC